jgi:hypothetical protein
LPGVRKIIEFLAMLSQHLPDLHLVLPVCHWSIWLRLTDGVRKGLKDAPRDALVQALPGTEIGVFFWNTRNLTLWDLWPDH